LVIKMEPEKIKAAPSTRTNREVFRAYHESGRSVKLLSDYLRERSFNA